MKDGALGHTYRDGEIIIRQGEVGDRMYVIQEGQVEILVGGDGEDDVVAMAGEGELIGEMAIFEREVRSATVRAKGEARLLTVDRKNFLRRVHDDPSLAFHVVQTMSRRVRRLIAEVAQLKRSAAQARAGAG